MTTIPERHRQTDRQIDRRTDGRTTCLGNTAQRVASRGKSIVCNTVYTCQTAARVVLTLCQCKCSAVPTYYRDLYNYV